MQVAKALLPRTSSQVVKPPGQCVNNSAAVGS